jgi:hypothetical protein
MARKLRVQYPGAICHVMSRGDRREGIFKDVTGHFKTSRSEAICSHQVN